MKIRIAILVVTALLLSGALLLANDDKIRPAIHTYVGAGHTLGKLQVYNDDTFDRYILVTLTAGDAPCDDGSCEETAVDGCHQLAYKDWTHIDVLPPDLDCDDPEPDFLNVTVYDCGYNSSCITGCSLHSVVIGP